MNKDDLARVLAKKNYISVAKAKILVDNVFNIMMETLSEGQKIEIRGFGSLSIHHYEAYTGRNPRTGELTDVKEKKLPRFKTGKDLKSRLNTGNDDVTE